MNTDLTDAPAGSPAASARKSAPRRTWMILGAAAAVVALVAGVGIVAGQNDSDIAEPPLELSLGQGDALASCMAFEVGVLAEMSPAFAATATAVEGETVTLTVDTWYAGGDADTVVLDAPAGMEALIAGFDFEVGQQYLITASDGVVNYCGYSGPATPEFTAAFEQAFGA